MKLLPLLLTTLLAKASLAYPLPLDHSDVDVLHYRFSIALTDANDSIDAVAEITILFKKTTDHFSLDLVARKPEGTGMLVSEVQSENHPLSFTHTGDKLDIQLLTDARAGETHRYRIAYRGIPENGLLIGKNAFGDRTFFANNWPDRARCWLPSIDHPADKATCEFIVTAPAHYQVVGNGVCMERTDLPGSLARTHWQETKVLPTKVMAIGVAHFAVFFSTCQECAPNIPLSTWLYPQTHQQTLPKFDSLPRVIDYFSRSIGAYPYEKMASVQSSNRYGGLENASAVFYKDELVDESPSLEKLIAHELAHQWFGNAVTEIDWPHLWLSEGFATYFTALYLEQAHSPEKLKEEMMDQRKTVIQYSQTASRPILDTLETDPNRLLNPNSYQKGSWVLHMLRRKVGDTVFWNGIRNYYQDYRHKNATTTDFQTTMEQAFGASLAPFFKQWLTQAGHPILSMNWVYRAKSGTVQLTLSQKQPGIFTFPIEIAVTQPDGTMQLHTVMIDGRSKTVKLPSAREPASILLDPKVNLLFEAQF